MRDRGRQNWGEGNRGTGKKKAEKMREAKRTGQGEIETALKSAYEIQNQRRCQGGGWLRVWVLKKNQLYPRDHGGGGRRRAVNGREPLNIHHSGS